jgi:hypothetical protein
MREKLHVIRLYTNETGSVDITKFLKEILIDAPTNRIILTFSEAKELSEILKELTDG